MPDTLGYLILGLAVTFGVLGVFGFSLVTRWRALQADLRALDALHDE